MYLDKIKTLMPDTSMFTSNLKEGIYYLPHLILLGKSIENSGQQMEYHSPLFVE